MGKITATGKRFPILHTQADTTVEEFRCRKVAANRQSTGVFLRAEVLLLFSKHCTEREKRERERERREMLQQQFREHDRQCMQQQNARRVRHQHIMQRNNYSTCARLDNQQQRTFRAATNRSYRSKNWQRRRNPAMLKPPGREYLFDPRQYFPPHFCTLFLKLPLSVVMLPAYN